MKKYNFVYITTNLVNNKQYIGKHSTDSLKDEYLGSGKLICKAIEKHGKENFKREILEFCENPIEAYKLEEKVISNFNAVNLDSFYNLTSGGKGNLGYKPVFTKEWLGKISKALKGRALSVEHRESISKSLKGREVWNKNKTLTKENKVKIFNTLKEYFKENKQSQETRDKISKALKGRISPMKGRKHSEETKRKISETLANKRIEKSKVLEV